LAVASLSPLLLFCRTKIATRASGDNLAQKCPLLAQDELAFFREAEIRHALGITAQLRTIVFVGRQIFEGDQREGDVVGALMRHEIADQIAAAARDDFQPALGILLELGALERIDLVADEYGDGQGEPPVVISRHCERKRSNPEPRKRTGLL